LREKITHFDHERIPERIVHARGSGAHGYFQPYKSMKHVTSANFLSDPKIKTPVFVRFSTVAGGAGSVDLPRDVRGFAVKFYTQEGNFDLVGNNIPVFFIQDAIKFPDLIHAVKMEADRGYPQAATAHDTFWDFVSLTKVRLYAEYFKDHYSQARLFYRSVTPQERKHMAMALTFELSKVEIPEIRKKMLGHLNVIDEKLGSKVADGLGMTGEAIAATPAAKPIDLDPSPALRLYGKYKPTLEGRKVGIC
jgi:catalase